MLDLILQQLTNGLALGMSYALVALGLTMVFGVLHIINFAHGEFYMLGAAGAVLLPLKGGLPYGAAVPVAVTGVALVAWIVDRVTVRPVLDNRDGATTVLLTTFAVSLLLEHGVLGTLGPAPVRVEGLDGTLSIGPVALTLQRVLVIGVGIVLLVALELVLRRTVLGKRIRAVAQSPFASRVVGIPIDSVRTVTFVGAAALAGLAGCLLAPIVLFTPVMGQHVIISAFVIVVVGGMGNVAGAVVCGIVLGVLEALASIVMPQEIGSAVIYALLLVMLLVRPQGLFARTR